MNNGNFTVFLVDDNNSVLRALTRVLEGKGYKVVAYTSAHELLSDHDQAAPGCAIFDYSMPDLNGLELQEMLAANRVERPIILISGVGEIPVSVKAMKGGAVDFLAKPVASADLLNAVALAVSEDIKLRKQRNDEASVNERFARLTRREKEVVSYVAAGMLNKQIAAKLGIVEKTIKLHRGRAMHKLGVSCGGSCPFGRAERDRFARQKSSGSDRRGGTRTQRLATLRLVAATRPFVTRSMLSGRHE
jgi:FixJ family two-component response regulator